MKKSVRLEFLESFLQLFGVEEVHSAIEKETYIKGIAIYDQTHPTEKQEFIWRFSEDQIPSTALLELVKNISAKNWHRGDFISFENEKNIIEYLGVDQQNTLIELYEIEVKMVDQKSETDSFFMHN